MNCVFLSIIFFSLLRHGVYSAINSIEPNTQEAELVTFAKRVYQQECKICRTTLIIYTEEEKMCDQFLESVSKDAKPMSFLTIPLKNYEAEQVNSTTEQPDLIIYFLDANFNNISVVVFGLEIVPLWNIRAKHLFIVSGVEEDSEKYWLKESFESLWEKQALRVVICFYLESNLKIMTYNPFLEDYYIDITNKMEEGSFFIERIKNMYGYPIKTYSFDVVVKTGVVEKYKNGKKVYNGLDGKYLGTVMESLNATFAIHKLSEDFDEEMVMKTDVNTKFMDALLIMREIYDFDMLTNIMKTFTDINMDQAFLNERNDFCIIIPSGLLIPQYLYILHIVPIMVWIPTIFTLVVVSLIVGYSQKVNKKCKWDHVVDDNLRLFLNAAIPSRERRGYEKVVLVMWMFFCLVFDTMFTSILTSTMVSPKYYPDLDTLEDVYEAGIKVYAPAYFVKQTMETNNDSRFLDILIALPKNVCLYGEDIDWISDYRHAGVMITTFQMYRLLKQDENAGRTAYHVVKESPLPNAVSYNMMKDKLYYRELQEALGKIQEAGLPTFWSNYNYDLEEIPNKRTNNDTYESNTEQPISLVHLQSGFMLLILGEIVALIVFVTEILTYKCFKERKEHVNKHIQIIRIKY